jgi:hypothetical protein
VLKAQLRDKIAQPLIPKGVSRKYITSGNLPSIMMRNANAKDGGSMPATQSSSAIDDLKARVFSKIKKRKVEE